MKYISASTLTAVEMAVWNQTDGAGDISMIAYADFGNGYALIYGVVGDADIWTPFTMRDGRGDIRLWAEYTEEDCGSAIAAVIKVVDGFVDGEIDDPHRLCGERTPIKDRIWPEHSWRSMAELRRKQAVEAEDPGLRRWLLSRADAFDRLADKEKDA